MPQKIATRKKFNKYGCKFYRQKRIRRLYLSLQTIINLYSMKKNRNNTVANLLIFGFIVAIALICIGIGKRPENHAQASNEKCILCRVENVSFNSQYQTLFVIKHFSDGYTEKARYCLPLLPKISSQNAVNLKMFEVATACGKSIAFDQSGNAYLIDIWIGESIKIGV